MLLFLSLFFYGISITTSAFFFFFRFFFFFYLREALMWRRPAPPHSPSSQKVRWEPEPEAAARGSRGSSSGPGSRTAAPRGFRAASRAALPTPRRGRSLLADERDVAGAPSKPRGARLPERQGSTAVWTPPHPAPRHWTLENCHPMRRVRPRRQNMSSPIRVEL